MIKLLGTINIPNSLIEYLKTATPHRQVSQMSSRSIQQQIVDIAHTVNVNNYRFYNDSNTGIIEYSEPWFRQIVPNEFLQTHGFEQVINAVVLKVEPGHFTAPHLDKFNGTVYAYDKDIEFDDIVRLWIPVEDCKFGQALFVESDVLYNYTQGQVYHFGNYDFHSAANAGLDHRYTLIVYCKRIKTRLV